MAVKRRVRRQIFFVCTLFPRSISATREITELEAALKDCFFCTLHGASIAQSAPIGSYCMPLVSLSYTSEVDYWEKRLNSNPVIRSIIVRIYCALSSCVDIS